MPHFYNIRPVPRPSEPSNRRAVITPIIVLLILAALYVAYCVVRPVGDAKTTIIPPVITGQVKVNIPWPENAQAAFGAQGYGLLASHGDQKALPTASVAKTITALAVLNKKPLKPGEDGPDITMTDSDVASYNSYVSQDGSAVPVISGETITERQALEAMMLPSANNIADTTAIWAFGSLQNYRSYASDFVKTIGMASTTIGTDASGFSPSTTSTANDLVHLGLAALNNPTLAGIVNEKQAIFPNYGTMENVNSLLGTNGIRGIKTGNSDQAGGVYLAAADVPIGNQKVTVVTAVVGTSTLGGAMRVSMPLISASASEFQNTQIVRANQKVGQVTTPWGASSDIVAMNDIAVLTWSGTGLSPHIEHTGGVHTPLAAHSTVGSLKLSANGTDYTSKLQTATAIAQPTLSWRLTHPF